MSSKTLRLDAHLNEHFLIESRTGNHLIRMDQPLNAAGTDLGPTPLELLLAALAGCFGTLARFIAHQRKFRLRGMQMSIEGDYDPAGLLGRSQDVRPGFSELRLQVRFDCDLSPAEQAELLDAIERRCPLADNLLHGTRLVSRLA